MSRVLSLLVATALMGCAGEATPDAAELARATLETEVVDSGGLTDGASFQEGAERSATSTTDPARALTTGEEASESGAATQAATVDEAPRGPSFALRRGETLAHFARWAELPVEDLAEASGLALDGQYAVGTPIQVPAEGAEASRIAERRAAHHQRRLEGYLVARGGDVGGGEHIVRSGESAWSIARQSLGVPVWVLEAYNPDVDLDRLRPGQVLAAPALADTLVDAGSSDGRELAEAEVTAAGDAALAEEAAANEQALVHDGADEADLPSLDLLLDSEDPIE